MSYEDLNLDPFLQSNNPFKDREKIFVNPYNFDVINDRNIIGATKLRDFSFNSGTGGTITLGGENDQNGVLIIRDASGNIITRGNEEGYHWYDASGNELIKIDEQGLHGYNTGGTETIRVGGLDGIQVYGTGAGDALAFWDSPGVNLRGVIGFLTGSGFSIQSGTENLELVCNTGDRASLSAPFGDVGIYAAGTVTAEAGGGDYTITAADDFTVNAADDINMNGNFHINGALKTAIVPTTKGYKSLFCVESPDVWFFDFCEGKKVAKKWWKPWEKSWIIKPDPLFLQTIEKVEFIMPTTKNVVQIWGKRIGFSDKRFEPKTKKDFDKNNKFWSP